MLIKLVHLRLLFMSASYGDISARRGEIDLFLLKVRYSLHWEKELILFLGPWIAVGLAIDWLFVKPAHSEY